MKYLIASILALALTGLWLAASGCGGAAPAATDTGADEAQAEETGDDEEPASWCCCTVCREEFFARKGGDSSGDFLGCLTSESWETEAECEAYGRGCTDKPQGDCSGYQ